MTQDELAYYASHGAITDPGEHARLFDGLPSGIEELCEVVQGLIVHPFWATHYGIEPRAVREDELQIRRVERMLARIIELDPRPLTEPRPPEDRLVGNCRDFTVLLCSMLRHQCVPARARCGFTMYFLRGKGEDHWVAEYWNADGGEWHLVDAQLDALQRNVCGIPFDTTDVPRNEFLVAGAAWHACRDGRLNPDDFGLSVINEHGLWWVRDNLIRDVAALNKVELLPWDAWGWALGPEHENTDAEIALLNNAPSLTQDPTAFLEIRDLYDSGDAFRVPATVRSMGPGGGVLVEIGATS